MNYNYYNVKKPDNKPINKGAVARIIVWSVVLLLLVGVFACAMMLDGEWSVYGFSLGGYDYNDANYHRGNGATRETVKSLSVDWPAGEVIIMPSDTDEVVITEEFDGDDALRLRWCVEDGELKIKYRSPVGFGNISAPSKKLTVAIPASMLASMEKVELELVSSNLTIIGMSADDADIVVVSGTVDMNCGFIDSLDVETVSGNVKFTGTFKEADFDGVSAKIELFLGDGVSRVNVDTVSGDVSVILPETVPGFEATMDGVSGSVGVHGFDDLTKTRDYCRYGDGSIKISVEAVSGSLKIGKIVAD
ncbi:MAG: DUF4097 family beta strand repeat protein [Clostridia bacterium]|nr:DUF4097 family beta strand repeat protein [Clostridia bacterium]